ncbi:MAG: IS1595 family transposase [Thermodesulfobacteriota bacterium]
MAKNMTQFQAGLSLIEFLSHYGAEEQCRASLFSWRWPNGFICPACGHQEFYLISARNLYQCRQCRRQTSLTSGTIFADTKVGLTVWFLGIYLVTQSKNGVSSLDLARALGVSANTALTIKHKLQRVMQFHEQSRRLDGPVQIDDAYLGGKHHGGKRGRGAPGKTPIIAALSTDDEGRPLLMTLDQVNGFTEQQVSVWSLRRLSPHSSVVSDGLQCFSGVKAADCAHQIIVTGGGADSVKIVEFKWVNTMLGNVKNAILGTYHAIRKNHIPGYLAEFCYRFNHRLNLRVLIARLAADAIQTLPIPRRFLKLAEIPW